MSEAASLDLLNAKLKLDVAQFERPIKAAADAALRFKQVLDSLGSQGSNSGGIRNVVNGLAAIGELAKRYFGMDVPQSIGKTKLALNELASGIGAVRRQVKGLGTDLTTVSRGANQAFASVAQAAQRAATSTKRSADTIRQSMQAAAQASQETSRALVRVGRSGDRMGEMVHAGALRAAQGVAGLAMTVQRAGQMIAASGMGRMLGGGRLMLAGPAKGATGGAFGVRVSGYTMNAPSAAGGPLLLPAPAAISPAAAGGASALAAGMSRVSGILSSLRPSINAIGSAIVAAFTKGLSAVQTFGNAARNSLNVVVSGMRNLTTAAAYAAASVGLIAGASVKVAATFEQSMARVKAVTNSTGAEFKALKDEANRLGIVTRYSAREASDAMGYLGLAGYKANDIIRAMPATLDLAAAGMMDTAKSADIMAKIMAGMQLPTDQLTKVTDILAYAFTNANTDLSQLGEAMKFVGPVGHAANKSLEEVTATLMVLGNNGYQASMGGTALRNILSRTAQEGREVRKVFDSLGVALKDDAGYLRPLADIIDDMNAAMKRQGREAEVMALTMQAFGERGGPGMAALLAEGGDAIRKYTTMLEQSAGTGKRIAAVQVDTLSGSWELLKSTIEQFQITLGEAIGKNLRSLMDGANQWLQQNAVIINETLVSAWQSFAAIVGNVRDAAISLYQVYSPVLSSIYQKLYAVWMMAKQWYDSLSPTEKNVVKVTLAMTVLSEVLGKVGGMIPFVGGLATAFSNVLNPLSALKGAVSTFLPILGLGAGLGGVLLALTGPAGILVAVIAAFGTLTAFLLGAGSTDIQSFVGGALGELIRAVKEILPDAFNGLKLVISGIIDFIKADATETIKGFEQAVDSLGNKVDAQRAAADKRSLGKKKLAEGAGSWLDAIAGVYETVGLTGMAQGIRATAIQKRQTAFREYHEDLRKNAQDEQDRKEVEKNINTPGYFEKRQYDAALRNMQNTVGKELDLIQELNNARAAGVTKMEDLYRFSPGIASTDVQGVGKYFSPQNDKELITPLLRMLEERVRPYKEEVASADQEMRTAMSGGQHFETPKERALREDRERVAKQDEQADIERDRRRWQEENEQKKREERAKTQDLSFLPSGAAGMESAKREHIASQRLNVAIGNMRQFIDDEILKALIKLESAGIESNVGAAGLPSSLIRKGGSGTQIIPVIERLLEEYGSGNASLEKIRKDVVDTLDRNLNASGVRERQQAQGQNPDASSQQQQQTQQPAQFPTAPRMPSGSASSQTPGSAPASAPAGAGGAGGVPAHQGSGAGSSSSARDVSGIGAEQNMTDALAKEYATFLTEHFEKTGQGGKGVMDLIRGAQSDIATSLKPDKDGNIDIAKAEQVAKNMAKVLSEMDGVSSSAAFTWKSNMIDVIKQLKDAPDGMKSLMADSVKDMPVTAAGFTTARGTHAGLFWSDSRYANENMEAQEEADRKKEEARKVEKFKMDKWAKAAGDDLDVKRLSNGSEATDKVGNVIRGQKYQTQNVNRLSREWQNSERNVVQSAIKSMPKPQGQVEAQQQQQAQMFIQGLYAQFTQLMEGARNATGQTQKEMYEKALKLGQGINAVADAMKKNTTDIEKLGEAAKDAGVDLKKLNEAEKEKLAHAQGQLTPQEQQMQQAQQQFQQQVQQYWQQQFQAGQQRMQQQGQAMFEGGQAMLQQALGGPGQVEAMIREASAKGDMKSAIALIRQRLEEQLKVSKSNLHNMASDVLAGGGFGPEKGGVSNDAYFMTLDIPLVRLIKFLQAQLDNLPKLAAGGIATKPITAMVGEAGPEAILPLRSFGNMLANIPVFKSIQSTMERLGNYFTNTGNTSLAQQYFANLSKVQKTFEYTMDSVYNMRRIDLSPAGMQHASGITGGAAGSIGMGGRFAHRGNFSVGAINLSVHGVDAASPAGASRLAKQLFDAFEQEASSRGYDRTGRSMFRSVPAATGRGIGYAR